MATKPTDDDGWGEVAEDDKLDNDGNDEQRGDAASLAEARRTPPTKTKSTVSGKKETAHSAKPSPEPTSTSTSTPPPKSSTKPSPEPTPQTPTQAESPGPRGEPKAGASSARSPSTEQAAATSWELPSDTSWTEPPVSSLSDAVGAEPKAKPNKPKRPPLFSPKTRNRLVLLTVIASILGALVIISWLNSRHLYLSCGETTVRAERGRFFPWGRTNLSGDRWKPIEPGSQCLDRELGSIAELEQAFLDLALSHANKNLATIPPTDLERAAALLEQAELLARAPERGQERADIERLSHDIDYWRAAKNVDDAISRLGEAQKTFEGAAGRTRHTSDAGDRATFLGELLEAVKRGTLASVPTDDSTGTEPAPTLEPTPNPTDVIDAGVATGTLLPAEVDAAPPPPPAPIPSGGVLL